MDNTDLRHHCYAMGYSDGEVGAFYDGYEKGRADAIEEYRKEMHDMIEGDEEFTDWQKYEILECNELVAEQLKEQNK